MKTHRIPTIILDDGCEQQLPFTLEICPDCHGHRESNAHIAAMSAEQVEEQGEQFLDDLLKGAHDKPCDRCAASGKVKVANLLRMSPLQAGMYLAQTREIEPTEAEAALERALGA